MEGDALLVQASVQDTVGTVQAAIEDRLERRHPDGLPAELTERIAAGELPLFTSTSSGLPPQIDPDHIDQVAYSYRSSQRPGVRVVFVSGYAEDSFGEIQMRIPNSVFLPKPFSLNDLTETVQRQLH